MPTQLSKRKLYQGGSILCITVGLFNLVGGVVVSIQDTTNTEQHVKMILSGIVLIIVGIVFAQKSTQPDQQIVLCGTAYAGTS